MGNKSDCGDMQTGGVKSDWVPQMGNKSDLGDMKTRGKSQTEVIKKTGAIKSSGVMCRLG